MQRNSIFYIGRKSSYIGRKSSYVGLRPLVSELPNVARLGDARWATGATLAGYGAPTT